MKKIEYPYATETEEYEELSAEDEEAATSLWVDESFYSPDQKVFFVCLSTGDKFIAGRLDDLDVIDEHQEILAVVFDKPLRVIEVIDQDNNLIKFATFLQFSKTNTVKIYLQDIVYMYEVDNEGYELHKEFRETIADEIVDSTFFKKAKKKTDNVVGITSSLKHKSDSP